MSLVYRDRAYCTRSLEEASRFNVAACSNTKCDRFADKTVWRLAEKAKLPIDFHDLQTSKCGFVPREGE